MLRRFASYTARARTARRIHAFRDLVGAPVAVKSAGGNGESSTSGSNTLAFAPGKTIGHLADASAVCSHGGSVLHATVCSTRNPAPTDDFLPLTVDYRSRAYAFGRIPQAANRRERHGADDEVLVARVIDRAVRPLFPAGYDLFYVSSTLM